MEVKSLRASVKAKTDSAYPHGEFEAILSTSALDRDGEVIQPGAFDPLPASIPIYHAHDWMAKALPIGRAEPYYEGEELRATGFFASTPKAQEVRALVNEGVVTSMSVGYLTGSKKSLGRGRVAITKGDLFEASFTAIPVNTTAAVLASKSVRGPHSADVRVLVVKSRRQDQEELKLRARVLSLLSEVGGLENDLRERERAARIKQMLADAREDRRRLAEAGWRRARSAPPVGP